MINRCLCEFSAKRGPLGSKPRSCRLSIIDLFGWQYFSLVALSIAPLLSSCTYFESEARHGYSENAKWKRDASAKVSYTTADVRLITERTHPVLGNSILCTEPSPDVAKALSTATQISANLGKATTSAELGVAGGSAEAVQELAGRTTALLALRDIVYRSCEAYANGSLGANAYTVVIAKYGQLLSTLFLAQDMTGVVGGAGSSGAVSPSIRFGSGLQLGQSSGGGPTAGGAPPKGAPAPGGTPAPGATLAPGGTPAPGGYPSAGRHTSAGGHASAGGYPSAGRYTSAG
jgi:hypothetical protein